MMTTSTNAATTLIHVIHRRHRNPRAAGAGGAPSLPWLAGASRSEIWSCAIRTSLPCRCVQARRGVTEMTHVRYRRPVPEREDAAVEPAIERAAAAAALGAGPGLDDAGVDRLLDLVRTDADARVRAAALAALVRGAPRDRAGSAWLAAAADADPAVRRRAVETAPELGRDLAVDPLLTLLHDADTWVAEGAAFALGERREAEARVVTELAGVATGHEDALVRESAIAALGALGDERGLPAVLAGCADKPAIRRRAVLALAAFEGPEVEAALQGALDDVDWQVRLAAEDLLHDDTP